MDDTGGEFERDGVLSDALSPSWSVRASAGRRLASIVTESDSPVVELLSRLVLDEQDSAVTQETVTALLSRGDVLGLRIVLAAFARATADWTVDEISAAITSDPR